MTTARLYIACYSNKKVEAHATSSYAAQVAAAKELKVPEKSRYKIQIVLADITHSTTTL